MSQNAAQLDYLHDAIVRSIVWKEHHDSKILQIDLRCDSECEQTAWANQHVSVVFTNVIVSHMVLLGHVAHADSFDRCHDGRSADLRARVEQMTTFGIKSPIYTLSLLFHSGSTIELACDSVEVNVT